MTERILGEAKSTKRKRFALLPVLAAVMAALFMTAGAQAVHDIGLFELDGNAFASADGVTLATQGDDWSCLFGTLPGSSTNCSATNGTPVSTAFKTDASIAFGNATADDILGGGSADIDDIDTWNGVIQSAPSKDDFEHAGWAVYTNPANGHAIAYFMADRYDNSGAAFAGFWFFLNKITKNADGTYNGVHAVGDTLVVLDNKNGGVFAAAYQWDPSCGKAGDPGDLGPCAAKNLSTLQARGTADCGTSTADPLCVRFSADGTPSAWPFQAKGDGTANDYEAASFFEGGIDLTEILHGHDCFTSVQAESRASESPTAELKDTILDQLTTCGTIKIVKDAIPDDANATFHFTSDKLAPLTFDLVDSSGTSPAQEYLDVKPSADNGTYAFGEVNIPTGWDLTSATCSDGSPVSAVDVARGETVTCTFTNTKRGALIVNKVCVGDTGTFNYTGTGSGVDASFSVACGGSKTFSNITSGTKSVSETVPTGWDLTSATCDDGSAVSAIDVGPGETVTCTFTNTRRATLIVSKVCVGGTGSFDYTGTGSGVDASFSVACGASKTFSNIAPGTKSVTETVPTGWDLTSASCSDGSSTTSIGLSAGETVTCTFTNTKRATLIVSKVCVGGSGSFNYTGTGTGVDTSFSVACGASKTFSDIPPGSKSVAETVPTGWDLTSATCDGTGNTPASITLGAGQTVTCTFTNTKRATLIVAKVCVGDTGTFSYTGTGSGVDASFSVACGATKTFSNIAPGTKTVAETVPTGWDLTSATCDDGSPVTAIDLAAGETVTCTFTNTRRGTLIVAKVCVGGTGTFNYTGTGAGVDASFSVACGASKTFSNIAPGTKTVAETVPTGWDLTSATCSDGSAVTAIDLAAGETVTCTFTNTKRGTLIVAKVCVGGTGSFDYTGTGTGVDASFSVACGASKSFTNIAPGTKSVAETVPTGWDLTSATCDGTGNTPASITLGAGQTVTCTFTNTKRGKLIVAKVCVGGTGSFDYTGTGSGVDASFSVACGASKTFSDIEPGTKTVAETVPTGWDLTSATCSDGSLVSAIGVSAGETVTCTFTNTKRGTLIVAKVCVGDTGTFSYTGTGSGVDASFSVACGASKTFSNIAPGTKTVAETVPTGWDLTSATCDDGSPVTAIGVGAGETVTCTFTNRKRGHAKVIKTVSGGPISGTLAFTFQIRSGATVSSVGTTVESGVANAANGGVITFATDLVPGQTYQLCEIVMPGWLTSLGTFVPDSFIPPDGVVPNPNVDNSILCINFTVAAGELKEFAVDNTPPPGGRALTIGFWKNWASCAKSNGGQKPVLDQTLALADPNGTVLSAGTGVYPAFGPVFYLVLHGADCAKAVNLLNKSTITGGKKMASDPLFNMTAQLLAAELNYTAGAGKNGSTTTNITSAVLLNGKYHFDGNNYTPKLSAADAGKANCLATQLDNYNNDRPVLTCL